MSPQTAYRRELRSRALDAALVRLNADGWHHVTMSSIAADVGVSRPTLYAEFGNKEGLGEALVRQETQRLLLGATAALRSRPDDAFAAMTDAASFILREAATSAVIAALLSPEGADGSLGLAYALPAGSGVIVPEMYDGLLAWFSEQCPDTEPVRLAAAVDAIIRLVVSYVLSPGVGTPDESAAAIARVAGSLLPEL